MAQTGKITDSWEEIIAAIDDESARQCYTVRATKELDLCSLGTVHMQLAGFNLDERADGQGKAATTWIAVELLPESRCMNETFTNLDGWQDSDLREYLQDIALSSIPLLIRQRIISVDKEQTADDKRQTTEETVWIPDYEEVSGDITLYYGLFQNKKENRVNYRQGSDAWWRLRSAYYTNYFRGVYGDGSNSNYGASNGGGGLGFCL